ncbi:hypothetical protein ACHAW6_012314 [Cyclotella cf. meneghiniana]
MDHPEYMQLKVADIPDDFIALYNLNQLTTTDGYIYALIQKGMYSLPQAGIIIQQLLEQCLAKKGYQQSILTTGFWKHDWHPISCTLSVDNFGIKYNGIKHAHHLIKTLNECYQTSQDWKATMVHLSMTGSCQKTGHCFHHPPPTKQQHQPYPHMAHTYGAKQQYTKAEDDSPLLNKADKTLSKKS